MKKQSNPSIKAHLLWRALILLSLLAVCAIPFTMAQQNAPGRRKPAIPPDAKRRLAKPAVPETEVTCGILPIRVEATNAGNNAGPQHSRWRLTRSTLAQTEKTI